MSPETKTRARWLGVGIVLAACVVGYGWARHAAKQNDAMLALEVKRQADVLDAIKATEAKHKSRPETITPALADDARRARAVGAGAVAAVRVVTREVPYAVPSDCPDPVQTGPTDAGESHPTPMPPPLPVTVSVDQQGLIFAQADGAIRWKGLLFATLRRGEWHETHELTEEAVSTSFAVDPALEAAWRRYVGGLPWQAEARLGVVFPDPGLRLGGTWYGKRRRMGWWADVDAVRRESSSYDSYTEATVYGQTVRVTGAAGLSWRIGPR